MKLTFLFLKKVSHAPADWPTPLSTFQSIVRITVMRHHTHSINSFYYWKFLIIFIYGDIGRVGRGPSMRVGSLPPLCGFLGIKFRLSSLAASTFICWVTLPDLILIKYGPLQTKHKHNQPNKKVLHYNNWIEEKVITEAAGRNKSLSSLCAEDNSTICQGTDSWICFCILWQALHHHYHHSLEAGCREALDLGF